MKENDFKADRGISINYHRSLLLRAQGDLDLSIAGFKNSIEEIEKGTPYQSLLHAACLYKIGCILIQKGDLPGAR